MRARARRACSRQHAHPRGGGLKRRGVAISPASPKERETGHMENIDLWLLEGGACVLFAVSMATDLRRRQIPNTVPVLLLALFGAYAFTDTIGSLGSLWPHLVIGVVMLGVGFVLYLTGSLGAGDGKLLAVAGLWVGLADMRLFLFGLGTAALALCVFVMLPFATTRSMRRNLPFALAIAPAAMAAIIVRSASHGP